jgi:hypothetical protein
MTIPPVFGGSLYTRSGHKASTAARISSDIDRTVSESSMNWCNRCTSAGSNNLPAIKVASYGKSFLSPRGGA